MTTAPLWAVVTVADSVHRLVDQSAGSMAVKKAGKKALKKVVMKVASAAGCWVGMMVQLKVAS